MNDAIAWLEANDFLLVESVPGHPNRLTLLDESGKRRRYQVPGAAYNRAKARQAEATILERHRYLRVPATFWTSGWLSVLSAAGIAMLLVLLAEGAGDSDREEVWFSPSVALNRYAFSEDTRGAGLDELRRAGIIEIRRRPVSGDAFELRRFRNVYSMRLDRLSEPAELPPRKPRSAMDDLAQAK